MNNDRPDSLLSFVPRYPVSFSAGLAIIALNFLALVFLRFDLFYDFSTHLIGGFSGDGGLYYWLFRHNINNFFSSPWFNTNSFYPYGFTLAWSDNFLLPSLIGYLLQQIGFSEVGSYNTIVSSAMLLSGVSTSYLAHHLSGKLAPSLYAGMLFMGSAYLSSVIGHPQLQFIFFLPLAIDCLFSFFYSRDIKSAVSFGACITLSFLTTVYYAIFIVVAGLILFTCIFLLRPGELSLRELFRFGFASFCGVFPLLLVIDPYFEVQSTFGERNLYEPYFFSAAIQSYFSGPYNSWAFSWTAPFADEESHLFLGFIPFLLFIPLIQYLAQTTQLKKISVLVIINLVTLSLFTFFTPTRVSEIGATLFSYLTIASASYFLYQLGKAELALKAWHLTNRSLLALLIYCALIFYILSLGPLGNPAQGFWALGVHRIFFDLIPGFDSIRAISRIGIIALLMISLCAAFSLALIRRNFKKSLPLIGLCFVLIFFENFTLPHPKEAPAPTPSALTKLNQIADANDAFIVLPYAGALKETGEFKSWKEFAKISVSAMNWALNTKLKVVNGYSGQQTRMMRDFPREVDNFPSDRALRALRSIAGLRYVLFTPQFKEGFNPTDFEAKFKLFEDKLRLIEKDSEGNYIFEIIAEQTLDDKFILSIPARPEKKLLIDIKALSDSQGEQKLDIFAYGEEVGAPYYTLLLTTDGKLHRYEIPLSLTKQSVSPLRLYFKNSAGRTLLLGPTVLAE